MADTETLPCVRDKQPAEEGGPLARQGFSYQDDVAVDLVLEMIRSDKLIEILCETQDDIILIWAEPSGEKAEYVQVKAGSLDQLWSIAEVCRRSPPKQSGSSLFEHSITRDCCIQESYFRIVTRIPVKKELKVLTFPLESPGRKRKDKELQKIADSISKKRPGISSEKGNGSSFWVRRCQWFVLHDRSALENSNLGKIAGIADQSGVALLLEQQKKMLDELRSMVKIASDSSWDPDPGVKSLKQSSIRSWWNKRLAEMTAMPGERASRKLEQKLTDAKLSEEQIRLAAELRRNYSSEVRTPRYMKSEEIGHLQQEVRAELMSLSAQFLAGDLNLNSIQFHSRCVEAVKAIDPPRRRCVGTN